MELNLYKKYLEKHLKAELEEVDLNKAKELLTKKSTDSSIIIGTTHLFKKDFFYRFIPYISLVGLICISILLFNFAIPFNSGKFDLFVNSYLFVLFFGFVFSLLYVLYFSSQRNKIIERMLKEKVSELENDKNDIFGYKKINKILTQTN